MNRVLPDVPYESLDHYIADGGGAGLTAARAVSPETVIGELTASGLRGRGGGGFPTGTKWATVQSFASPELRTSIVVNAAEGEPGTFKDRAILRANPYAVIEGALIAAHTLDAMSVIIATKASFVTEIECLRSALSEVRSAGWPGNVTIEITEGPAEYLFGEETGLLEVLDGRPPFPRIAPPFRHGVVELVESQAEADSGSGSAASVQMAEPDGQSGATRAREQRRDDGQRARDHCPRCGVVPIGRHGRLARDRRLHHHRRGAAPRRDRSRDGHPISHCDRIGGGHGARSVGASGAGRRVGRSHHGRSARHAIDVRGDVGDRQRIGFGRFHRHR